MSNRPAHRPATSRPGRPAFTLVELMISIALVALLILGVNQVFLYTGQAVGAGQAIGDAVRDARAAQTTFANDFLGIAPNGTGPTDSAFLSIYSAAQPAFLNAADQAASRTGNPLQQDLNGNGVEGESTVPGEVISPATYNSRNHRLDMLGFFTRGTFARQTGNSGTFVDNMTSPEAFVSYGHLWLPDNSGNFNLPTAANSTYPGPSANAPSLTAAAATNPNNVYASQFVLGRIAMLLKEPTLQAPSPASPVYKVLDPSGTAQSYTASTANSGWSCPLFDTQQYADSQSAPSSTNLTSNDTAPSPALSTTTSSGGTRSLSLVYQSGSTWAGRRSTRCSPRWRTTCSPTPQPTRA